ncbi:MAG: PEP/pyruvate-binding domain-containing protein, partial [Candidatus Promineifilaceae bacterium]|nr:PEP/pyruvate-binding domain-containing protein [Candidatus Promineifilaceae bacterium]
MTKSQGLPDHFLVLGSPDATLETVGGKALNLARLARANFPIPPGFFIPTAVYREFVSHNDLSQPIAKALSEMAATSMDDLSAAAEAIQRRFRGASFPPGLAAALDDAWRWLGAVPVAVRSSATAEDLPGFSFAGQQDTYLNTLGGKALHKAVAACWVSLWTARAIGYRLRNGISQQNIALAVIVQAMVPSESSGVLFTANPLTGLRSETVIDATFGLGEALVGGHVEPDHYVVDMKNGSITHKFLGSKKVLIEAKSKGGVITRDIDAAKVQAIPDALIGRLAQIGAKIENLFHFPQDIEWAYAEGELHILQSRPITSLFPLPQGLPHEPLQVFLSFAAVQGVLDPLTPLGRDAVREIFTAGGRLFGIKATRDTQTAVYESGERLWINITALIRNSIGRRVVPAAFGLVEPGTLQAVEGIWNDQRLLPGKKTLSAEARGKILRILIPLAANILMNLAAPRRRRAKVIAHGEDTLHKIEARCAAIAGDRWQKLDQRADLLPDFGAEHFPQVFLLFVSVVAAGMASWNLLNKLAARAVEQEDDAAQLSMRDLALQVTRGMPYNPTTEMDLALWAIARHIGSEPASVRAFQNHPASELAALFLDGELPGGIQQDVREFMKDYGGRGLAEIDLGRTRWADDPTYIFETLASYLQITDENQAPDKVFAQGAESAQRAIGQIETAVRQTRLGWFKARLVRFFAGRARQLMGARENPKFFAVRVFWLIQQELLQSGREFVRAGELHQANDLFYLTTSELKSFAAQEERDWRPLIAARRQTNEREYLRRQIPRLLLSDGRAFYEGVSTIESSGKDLIGSPVSPGSVEGRVRVVLNPTQAGLIPGEILVCPGTDPSWTPLFLSAAGLVMEVGGMMTHGAVVAREYGIPA